MSSEVIKPKNKVLTRQQALIKLSRDKNRYAFEHKEGYKYKGTMLDFVEKYNVYPQAIVRWLTNKQLYIQNWKIVTKLVQYKNIPSIKRYSVISVVLCYQMRAQEKTMNKYKVKVFVEAEYDVIVEAEDEDIAERLAEEAWDDGGIITHATVEDSWVVKEYE